MWEYPVNSLSLSCSFPSSSSFLWFYSAEDQNQGLMPARHETKLYSSVNLVNKKKKKKRLGR